MSREFKILVLSPEEASKSYNHVKIREHSHVVVCYPDGKCEVLKDRWDWAGHKRYVTLALPEVDPDTENPCGEIGARSFEL